MGQAFVCIGHGVGVVMRHSVPSQAPLNAIRSRRSAWQAAVSPCNGIEVAPRAATWHDVSSPAPSPTP
ncbi:hypothetical protein [Streptomyces sp. NPDC048825]|uniref:hypothetical protein n=1 Tax=Streptomyces sp. NPDC048825 TaxID=3365592 RepID=UPI0037220D30